MAWSFVLSDLNGNVHGELTNASARQVRLPFMRVPTASCTIPIWSELGDTVMNTDTLLKCYRTDPNTGTRTLAFHGPVISAEEVAQGPQQTIAINAAGPFWRLAKRLIPGSLLTTGVGYGTPEAPIAISEMASQILTAVNGASYTGISLGTHTPTSRTGYVGPWWLKPAAEAIAELHAGVNSFEYEVAPTEPTNVGGVGGWPKIGNLNMAPTLGTTRSDAIFEYGTDRSNVSGYRRLTSRENMLTRAYLSVQGWPDAPVEGRALRTREDSASITSRGLFDELVSEGGTITDDIRDAIGDFHVALRKQPRQTIHFTPVLNARPSALVDYFVGDTVRARATVRGSLRFDALFRIWGITFDVDKNGNESVDLELVMP